MNSMELLAEAARAELVRIYSTTSHEYNRTPIPANLDQDRADELAERRQRRAAVARRKRENRVAQA